LLLTEAVKIQEASIGDDHPDLATTLCTLGNLRSTLHEFDDAERHLERAIAIYRARLGADHPDLGIALQNLAMVKRERGDLKAAKARVEEALVILTKRLPPDDATVLGTRMSLAGVLRALGELAEAERESRSIFEARRRMFSVDSNESASSRTLLAQILTDGARAGGDASKSQEAAVLLRELLEARSKGPKAGDWRTAVAESCLADALALRGERLDEARRLAESSYESLRASSSIPGQHRDAILVDALERCVRVLEAVEAEAPGSAGDAALAAWRVKLRDARAAKDRPAEPVK
jgi:tetratricopeptide (TPR) repeat protein